MSERPTECPTELPPQRPVLEGLPGLAGRGPGRSRTPDVRSPLERFAPSLLLLADLLIWLACQQLSLQLVRNSVIFSPWFYLLGPLVFFVALYLIGGYDRRTDFLSLGYVSEHVIGVLTAAVMSMFVAYAFLTFNEWVKPSRAFIPLMYALLVGPTLWLRRWLGLRLRKHRTAGSLLVLGAGDEAKRFYRTYTDSGLDWNLEFVALEEGSTAGNRIDGESSPVVETDALAKLAQAEARYAAVLLACEAARLPRFVLHQLVDMHCSNVPVLTVRAFHEKQWRKVSLDGLGPEWLFDSEFRLARGSVFSHVKRLFDVVFAAVALVVLSPLLLLFLVMIRLESRGPGIFRQERVGREGRRFVMYKFRTMRENTGDIYTRAGDDRITWSGRWMRVLRLDELPQLWNVLIGDMSLIGPRAEWVKLAEIYEAQIPHYHLRHLVHPGITGWAQVKFKYGESQSDTLEKFQYDLYYIRHFSLEMDVSIVLKTIHIMLLGKGR